MSGNGNENENILHGNWSNVGIRLWPPVSVRNVLRLLVVEAAAPKVMATPHFDSQAEIANAIGLQFDMQNNFPRPENLRTVHSYWSNKDSVDNENYRASMLRYWQCTYLNKNPMKECWHFRYKCFLPDDMH